MLDQIKKFDVFSNCNEDLLKEVVKNLRIQDEKAGITILNQGDDTKSLYLILDGTLLVTQLAIDGKIVSLELSKKVNVLEKLLSLMGHLDQLLLYHLQMLS